MAEENTQNFNIENIESPGIKIEPTTEGTGEDELPSSQLYEASINGKLVKAYGQPGLNRTEVRDFLKEKSNVRKIDTYGKVVTPPEKDKPIPESNTQKERSIFTGLYPTDYDKEDYLVWPKGWRKNVRNMKQPLEAQRPWTSAALDMGVTILGGIGARSLAAKIPIVAMGPAALGGPKGILIAAVGSMATEYVGQNLGWFPTSHSNLVFSQFGPLVGVTGRGVARGGKRIFSDLPIMGIAKEKLNSLKFSKMIRHVSEKVKRGQLSSPHYDRLHKEYNLKLVPGRGLPKTMEKIDKLLQETEVFKADPDFVPLRNMLKALKTNLSVNLDNPNAVMGLDARVTKGVDADNFFTVKDAHNNLSLIGRQIGYIRQTGKWESLSKSGDVYRTFLDEMPNLTFIGPATYKIKGMPVVVIDGRKVSGTEIRGIMRNAAEASKKEYAYEDLGNLMDDFRTIPARAQRIIDKRYHLGVPQDKKLLGIFPRTKYPPQTQFEETERLFDVNGMLNKFDGMVDPSKAKALKGKPGTYDKNFAEGLGKDNIKKIREILLEGNKQIPRITGGDLVQRGQAADLGKKILNMATVGVLAGGVGYGLGGQSIGVAGFGIGATFGARVPELLATFAGTRAGRALLGRLVFNPPVRYVQKYAYVMGPAMMKAFTSGEGPQERGQLGQLRRSTMSGFRSGAGALERRFGDVYGVTPFARGVRGIADAYLRGPKRFGQNPRMDEADKINVQFILQDTEELKKAGFNEKTIEKLRKKFNVSPTN